MIIMHLKRLLVLLIVFISSLNTAYAASKAEIANDGVVKIIAGSRGGTYTQLTTEMMSVLPQHSEDGRVRVVPIIGVGSKQNLQDLLYLKGIDIVLVQNDVLANHVEEHGEGIKSQVRYIAKLHDEEFHLLASTKIKNIEELNGKKVSFGQEGSGTSLTANAVFNKLGINVTPVYRNIDDSIRALKAGEISALVYVSGKPVSALKNRLSSLDNVHFLSVQGDALKDFYSSTKLTASDYPDLITGSDINTVKVDAILAVYNFPAKHSRYANITRFANAMLNSMDELQNGNYHAKWASINPCSPVPGWTRHDIIQEACGNPADASKNKPQPQQTAASNTQQTVKSIEEQRDLLLKYYVNNGFDRVDAELVVSTYNEKKVAEEYTRLFGN